MEDYTGNSKKEKEGLGKPPKQKAVKVISDSTEIIVKKRGLGQKIKDVFIEADFRSVTNYVLSDVLIPALRNMIVDGASKGVERMMYGDSRRRSYGPMGTRITYNNPISRPYSGSPSRVAPPITVGSRTARQARDDIILASRDEAELVLERLNDIIDTYQVACVGDLHDLLGLASSHVDQKWGWTFVGDASVKQVREGYLIDLPPAEPLQ